MSDSNASQDQPQETGTEVKHRTAEVNIETEPESETHPENSNESVRSTEAPKTPKSESPFTQTPLSPAPERGVPQIATDLEERVESLQKTLARFDKEMVQRIEKITDLLKTF